MNLLPNLTCPKHPDRYIEKVDPNPSTNKRVYCLECILDNPQAYTLNQVLPKISVYLNNLATSFAEQEAEVVFLPIPPQEYLQFISGKAVRLEKLNNQIENQKAKVGGVIEEMRRSLDEMITAIKTDLWELLDNQLYLLSDKYNLFETTLKRFYPDSNDVQLFSPSLDELYEEIRMLQNGQQLEDFMSKMNQKLEKNIEKIKDIVISSDLKDSNLNLLRAKINNISSSLIDLEILKDKIATVVDNSIKKIFELQDSLSEIFPDNRLTTVLRWLPQEYQNFVPKLIFKGTRDGFTPEAFHWHCVGKGPTITLITCNFDGSEELSVIGGFLDQDWENSERFIYSNKAFIFSLTPEIKCPISEPMKAAYSSNPYFISFGFNGDITIDRDLENSYMQPGSYMHSDTMIQSSDYEGGTANFVPIEIEVYSLRRLND